MDASAVYRTSDAQNFAGFTGQGQLSVGCQKASRFVRVMRVIC